MTRIVHLTDLHFGAADPAVVTGLRAAIQADPPDLVAISGDLTQGAHRGEFQQARAFMDAMPCPVLAVPGNHDITPYRLAERFLTPYRRWHEEISPETEPLWRNEEVVVAGLNTARRAGPHLDWSRGRVTHHRLGRLIAKLDALPHDLVRIVVAHHPLLLPEADTPVPITTVPVGGARRALAAFARHGVRLVIAGHLHRSYSRLSVAGAESPLILQGGSATSTRLRGEPNSYNLVTVEAGLIGVVTFLWEAGRWQARETAPGKRPWPERHPVEPGHPPDPQML